MPAKAAIQVRRSVGMDSRFRGNDESRTAAELASKATPASQPSLRVFPVPSIGVNQVGVSFVSLK